MPTKRPRDPLALAKLIGDIATGQVADAVDDGKEATAVETGRVGGAARAQSLTSQQRTEIDRKAAQKRWRSG